MNGNTENRTEKTSAFYALVRGRVQGVGFRYSALHEAERLRIKGWVKNSRDGNVEVWAEGAPETLERFLEWLQNGPRFSRVESVRKENMEPKGYRNFNVEY